jgi:hypothetical protein
MRQAARPDKTANRIQKKSLRIEDAIRIAAVRTGPLDGCDFMGYPGPRSGLAVGSLVRPGIFLPSAARGLDRSTVSLRRPSQESYQNAIDASNKCYYYPDRRPCGERCGPITGISFEADLAGPQYFSAYE